MTSAQNAARVVRPRPQIDALTVYRLPVPAGTVSESLVKLNQNESPLDWPAELKEDVLRRMSQGAWNRYPPVDGERLRDALAAAHGVRADMVAVTNGSNEAILALMTAFASGRQAVLTAPGYSMARTLAVVGGAEPLPVPLRPGFSLDADLVIEAARRADAPLVLLASPNNPTGNAFARPALEAVIQGAPGLVVLDEAYAQFASDTFLPDLRRYPHLAILRTFSKAFALAGARVGWILAAGEIIAAVRKALPPYNLNLFAQEAALAALARPDLVAARVEAIVRERTRGAGALAQIGGVEVFPTDANFILFRTPHSAGAVFDALRNRGVVIRDVSGQPALERCLRVTIGRPEENDRFLEALAGTLAELR